MSKPRKGKRTAAPMPRTRQVDQIDQTVALFTTITDTLAQHSGINPREHGPRQRVLRAYLFGMLLAYGKREQLPPATLMGAMNMVLVVKGGYDPLAADRVTRDLLDATQPGHDPAQHAIIYRGIDGMTLWSAGHDGAVSDFLACLATSLSRSIQ